MKLASINAMVELERTEEIVEEIYLAVPKSESRLKNVRLSDFSDYGFVNLAGSKQFRVMCDRFCALAGLKQKIVFESDSIIAVKNLISAGTELVFGPHFHGAKLRETLNCWRLQNLHANVNW